MITCYFVSDLHVSLRRYNALFQRIEADKPNAVFIGGDIMPGFSAYSRRELEHRNFLSEFLEPKLINLKRKLLGDYPRIFIILGNDDSRIIEEQIIGLSQKGVWEYIHFRRAEFCGYTVYGYNYIPPTPFRLKDWERYDVSRYVDPGSISPEDGALTVAVEPNVRRYSTIEKDLAELTGNGNAAKSLFLFHSPPYNSNLDRAALDGKMVDHVPLDVHVGSLAIRRFIEIKQPYLTLHGHIHESARLTGNWRETIEKTAMFSAAHDGSELALIKFNLDELESAERLLI